MIIFEQPPRIASAAAVFFCHCERSEAIQGNKHWARGSWIASSPCGLLAMTGDAIRKRR
jgi:hypothetical protein